MKIVLVGQCPKLAALHHALGELPGGAGLYRSREEAFALVQQGIFCDHLIFDGPPASEDELLLGALRKINPEVKVAYLSFSQPEGMAPPKLIGVFEKTALGLRALHCVYGETESWTEGNCALGSNVISYEFQRACGKRGPEA